MATEIAIVNQALLLLGEGLLTSGQMAAPDNKASRTVSAMLPLSLSAVLRDTTPASATEYSPLLTETAIPQPPHPDHLYLFDLPADCLRVVRVLVYDSASQYQGATVVRRWKVVRASKLACDDPEVAVEYIHLIDVSEADPVLAELLAAHLAWKLAIPMTESIRKAQAMRDLYNSLKEQATGADESEGHIEQFRSSSRMEYIRHGGH